MGTIATRLRDLVRQVCTELEVEILKGHVSKDHVHLYVSCPPHVSPSSLMQRVKGRSFRKLMAEFAAIRKACWGRHVWARGFFVASSGNVTDEIVWEYIEKQEVPKPDDNFKVSDGKWEINQESGFQPTEEPATFPGGGSVSVLPYQSFTRIFSAPRIPYFAQFLFQQKKFFKSSMRVITNLKYQAIRDLQNKSKDRDFRTIRQY